jgi:hypothetical protein
VSEPEGVLHTLVVDLLPRINTWHDEFLYVAPDGLTRLITGPLSHRLEQMGVGFLTPRPNTPVSGGPGSLSWWSRRRWDRYEADVARWNLEREVWAAAQLIKRGANRAPGHRLVRGYPVRVDKGTMSSLTTLDMTLLRDGRLALSVPGCEEIKNSGRAQDIVRQCAVHFEEGGLERDSGRR